MTSQGAEETKIKFEKTTLSKTQSWLKRAQNVALYRRVCHGGNSTDQDLVFENHDGESFCTTLVSSRKPSFNPLTVFQKK